MSHQSNSLSLAANKRTCMYIQVPILQPKTLEANLRQRRVYQKYYNRDSLLVHLLFNFAI